MLRSSLLKLTSWFEENSLDEVSDALNSLDEVSRTFNRGDYLQILPTILDDWMSLISVLGSSSSSW